MGRLLFLVLACSCALLSALAAPALLEVRVDASTDSMVLEDDPEALRYDRCAQLFASDEFVLVGVRRDDLFEPAGIDFVRRLHRRLAAIAFVGSDLAPGSPAARAGLRPLDRIVALGAREDVSYHTLPELLQEVAQEAAGEPVALVVRRPRSAQRTERVRLAVRLPQLAPDALRKALSGARTPAEVVARREAFVRTHLGVSYHEGVRSVLSMTSVPLFRSHRKPVPPFQALLQRATLGDPRIDPAKARAELTSHALFANNIVSRDGRAAGLLVTLRPVPRSVRALRRKLELYERRAAARARLERADAPAAERDAARAALAQVEAELEAFRPEWVRAEDARKRERVRIVHAVREIVAEERARGADVRASGVPAIVVAMVEAIEGDLRVFSLAVAGFLVAFLTLVFRRARWVLLPLLATGATVVWTLWCMEAFGKRITVITSNVPALLLVLGLAHSIHMIVRYRELLVRLPEATSSVRVRAMVRSLVLPCLFTATTTCAGFLSLVFAGSRPIIDFGLFMALGVLLAFVLSFVFLPAALLVLPRSPDGRLERSGRALEALARGSLAHRRWVLGAALLLALGSALGVARLDVEARFIDYFSPDSPIHKGLTYIDRNLGGTSGLEVVLSAPSEAGAFGPRHRDNLDRAAAFAEWLAGRPHVGVVMSFTGLVDEVRKVFPAADRGQAALFVANNLPADLLRPYLVLEETELAGRRYAPYSAVRITARLRETDPDLDRGATLRAVRAHLAEAFPPGGAVEAEVTGMFVLYANMLQSLVGSQAKTSLTALAVIFLMLAVLFRSLAAAALALIPNALPIVFVLGAMGWSGIPLDMATVMIASVSLGIGVDCAIHYLFRYREEVALDGDISAALRRSHASIGTSILYTSLTTVVGFSVLAVSNFRPNAYFGIFTGFAMVAALFAMLTVLPVLIFAFRPFRRELHAGRARAARSAESREGAP
ncbi:MAG: hypothetical protein D6731_16880 [Planctomycetota bacterium]|nr:MAG: hypothetical protein D6731_16880 [Planctomycetota bacterium]